jgi:hypothetical protein
MQEMRCIKSGANNRVFPPSPVQVSLNIRDCELMMGFRAPFISRDLRLSPGLALGFSIAT